MRPSIAVAFLALLSCGATSESGPTLRVLFVGNSLTYYNDLPGMVKAVAAAQGVELTVKSYAEGGWGLEDHWNAGHVREEIVAERWDVVIMQQGPSSLAASRLDLLTWATRFDSLADLHHTCLAFYMVWPDAAHRGALSDVYDHYKEAADTTGGQFLPAGRAWQLAWLDDPTLPYYGPDDFHPSLLGTYAAALVIVGGLTGQDPVQNTASIPGLMVTGAVRAATKRAARDALAGVPRRCVE